MSLFDELTTGLFAAEIAPFILSGNDSAISELLNGKNISVNDSVSVNTFALWCASTGMRATIQDHAGNTASPLRSIALTLLDLLQGNLQPASLDLSVSGNVVMLDAWIAAGALTQSQKDELILLSQKTVSRAEQLGIDCSIPAIAFALRGQL